MERIFLNQTALSLGYIALKRIRALEEPTTRLPSSPLLRHLGHIKILAACVEQVGPEEIIEYEINQDIAVGEPFDGPVDSIYNETETKSHQRIPERKGVDDDVDDDVADPRYPEYTRHKNNKTKPLCNIPEDDEDICSNPQMQDFEPKSFFITNLAQGDIDEDEYSMDELYDEYNSQEENWETASEDSDDTNSHVENVPPSRSLQKPLHLDKVREIETDSDEEEDAPTPPNVIISHSPPLDITLRHPITHELSKRERYRRQADSDNSDLSCAFVEQIEDVLCHEIRYLSFQAVPGRMRLETLTQQPVSLYE